MRKNGCRISLRVLLAVLFLCIISAPAMGADTGKTSLSKLTGDVSVVRSGANVENVKSGLELAVNDEVITGANSSADVRFPSAEVIRIMGNSRVRINQGSENNISLDLTRGKVFNVVFKYVDRVTNFKVVTPTATAGVRGTVFSAEHDDDDDTSVIMVKQGSVGVANPAVSSMEVMVGDLQKTIVAKGKMPTTPVALTAAEIAVFDIIADLIKAGPTAGGESAGISPATGAGIAAGLAAVVGGVALASDDDDDDKASPAPEPTPPPGPEPTPPPGPEPTPPPTPSCADASGTWTLNESWDDGTSRSRSIEIKQTDCTASLVSSTSFINGSLSNNVLTWTESFPQERTISQSLSISSGSQPCADLGEPYPWPIPARPLSTATLQGMTNVSYSATINGDVISGSGSWSWNDSTGCFSTSGGLQVSGTRN